MSIRPAERLNYLVPNLSQTIARFPVCCFVALVLFCFANLDIAEVHGWWTQGRVYQGLVAAFLAGGAGHLFGESRSWSGQKNAALAAGGAAVFGIALYFQEVTAADPLFLVSGALLLVMTAAFLRPNATEEALWLFNARLGLAATLAFLVALVFCGGLSAIVASLDYLFDLNAFDRAYAHIWVSGATLIGPLYGLSLMPVNLGEEFTFPDEPSLIERGASALINYTLAPMVLIYLMILHLYAGKIALEWSLPKGQIGIMVLSLGLGGTATYLIARPWANRSARPLRWFLASWFWLAVVPVGLLAIAVYRRIAEYGVTPERYGLLLVGFWLAAMILYFAWRRRLVASRTILASLAVLLLAGAVGPWGAKGLSIISQSHRMYALLTEYGFLDGNGRLVSSVPAVPAAVAADGASIIFFLSETNALDRLEPIFDGRRQNPFEGESDNRTVVGKLEKQLGFSNSSRDRGRRDQGHYVRFESSLPLLVEVDSKHQMIGPLHLSQDPNNKDSPELADVTVSFSGKALTIERGGQTWTFDTHDILARAQQRTRLPEHGSPIMVELDGKSGTAQLVVVGASGRLAGSTPEVDWLSLWLLLPNPGG